MRHFLDEGRSQGRIPGALGGALHQNIVKWLRLLGGKTNISSGIAVWPSEEFFFESAMVEKIKINA